MKKKLKGNSGETLVETLFSMLIIVLAVLMLAGSVVAAAKVNNSGKDLDTAIQYDSFNTIPGVKVKITHGSGTNTEEISVTAYQTNDENHYCYYK